MNCSEKLTGYLTVPVANPFGLNALLCHNVFLQFGFWCFLQSTIPSNYFLTEILFLFLHSHIVVVDLYPWRDVRSVQSETT